MQSLDANKSQPSASSPMKPRLRSEDRSMLVYAQPLIGLGANLSISFCTVVHSLHYIVNSCLICCSRMPRDCGSARPRPLLHVQRQHSDAAALYALPHRRAGRHHSARRRLRRGGHLAPQPPPPGAARSSRALACRSDRRRRACAARTLALPNYITCFRSTQI